MVDKGDEVPVNGTQSRWWMAYLQDMLLSRALPGLLFALLLTFKALSLAGYLGVVEGTWGITEVASVAQQASTIVFLAIVVVLFVVRKPVVGRRSGVGGAAVALGGSFIMSVPVAAPLTSANPLTLAVSALLTLGGAALTVVSLLTLGRCFGIFPEARGLVTRWPYSVVRHPVYVGEITSTLGQVAASFTPWLLGLFLVFVLLQNWRASYEERALLAAFPEYGGYAARTKRFIPGVF